MEYIEGVDLYRYVAKQGPLSEARAVAVIRQAAASLDEAHSVGLVHRDIKPSNIMRLTSSREAGRAWPGDADFVKVLDFGLVRRMRHGASSVDASRTSNISGTPLYMAPEQVIAPEDTAVATDIYALGCVLFFLVTGRHLVHGDSAKDAISEHIYTSPRALLDRAPQLSSSLRAPLLESLAKKPEERWPSMAEFSEALCALPELARAPYAVATAVLEPQEGEADEGVSEGQLTVDLRGRN